MEIMMFIHGFNAIKFRSVWASREKIVHIDSPTIVIEALRNGKRTRYRGLIFCTAQSSESNIFWMKAKWFGKAQKYLPQKAKTRNMKYEQQLIQAKGSPSWTRRWTRAGYQSGRAAGSSPPWAEAVPTAKGQKSERHQTKKIKPQR